METHESLQAIGSASKEPSLYNPYTTFVSSQLEDLTTRPLKESLLKHPLF